MWEHFYGHPTGTRRSTWQSIENVTWFGCSTPCFDLVQVRPIAEDEMFRVLRTGKRKSEYSLVLCSLFYHMFLIHSIVFASVVNAFEDIPYFSPCTIRHVDSSSLYEDVINF